MQITASFHKKVVAGYQTILIEDQAPRFVGPDLDQYCLQRHFKITVILKMVKNMFILF